MRHRTTARRAVLLFRRKGFPDQREGTPFSGKGMGGQLSDFELEADQRSVPLLFDFDQADLHQEIDVAADGSTADLSLAFGAPFAALNIGLQADRLPAMSTLQQARQQD